MHTELSIQTAVIGQSVYTTPFVILLVSARLQSFDRALERAASDLGANAFNRLRLVILPLLLPAILAGALFAFTLSLDEFIITYFLIGGHNTLPIYIYTQVKFGITPEVNALAAMLLGASLTILTLAFTMPQLLRAARRAVRGRRAGRPTRKKFGESLGSAILESAAVREQDRSGFEGLEGCAEMVKCDGRWPVSQMAGGQSSILENRKN